MRQHLASGHSAARCLAGIFLALICLLPASCTDSRDTITVGSKNFGESNVLAQMFAILIRERGIPVAGPIEYPSTQSVLEALKRGDIDIYPDYNGTGLGMHEIVEGKSVSGRVESGGGRNIKKKKNN